LRETKQNSDELMSFLDFSDIEDFTNVQPLQFIEYTNSTTRSKKAIIKDKMKCLAKRERKLFSSDEALS
jgi:hypothetical protein